MTTRALTIHDIAREFGRSPEWMSDNWRRLVREKKLAPPLLDQGPPTWSAAHVYAVMDRHLPAAARANAAGFRAALDAAIAAPEDVIHHDELADSRRKLDARFGGNREREEA